MATEVKIPVRLEVLQDSISQIKAILSNLSPNSSSWKDLSNILRQMNKEADSLSGAFKKPFGSQNQFKTAEKSIGKIEETLNRVSMVVGRINFSELELTPEQSATLKQFESQIEQLENKAKNFKSVMKQELQQGDAWQDILLIDKNAVIHSYDEIVKEIQKKVRSIENEQKKAQDAFNVANSATQKSDRTLSFFESKGDLKQAFGDSWNQFFIETTNGATRIQGGQHGPLFDWLKNNLEIRPSELKQIGEMNVTNLRRWISEYDVSNITNQLQKNKSTEAIAKEKLTAVNAEYAALESASKAIATTQGKVATSNTDIQKSVQNVREEEEAWKRSVEQTARTLVTQTGALSNLSAACEQLRSTLMHSNEEWLKMSRITNTMSGIRNAIVNFMGFNQILNITRNATRQALSHIQELDTVMSKIAIVTDMSTKDLWNQVDAYSSMASAYGVSIKGAYEVSQIYYQQGLETADVLTLTNETLKLAKVSGLDYATTTDYMTTALRGFKMDMQDAGVVVDVYSALAANTAVSQEELAVAMSKTASSMQSVGSTFEETSAMIGTMVAVTRESATNIGSAMKSIASRYGELTKNPLSLVDEEGEVMAFNKVDTALQSVGISMKTVDGQFRSFTEVILELSEKWDTLDSTQQRYIATQFAGNRQQSRFLALVSNSDILRENLEVAQNAEDTGDLQALKALDSIESKIEQVKVAYQQFYTTMGVESIWKLGLDGLKEYIEALNNLPKIFGKLPVGAIGAISNIITLIHGIGDKIVSSIAKVWERAIQGEQIRKVAQNISQNIQTSAPEVENSAKQLGQVIKEGVLEGMSNVGDEVAKALAQVRNNAVENGLTATEVAKSVTAGTQKPVKLNDVVGPNFNSDLIQRAGGINADNLGDLDAVASKFREEAARLVIAAKGEVQAAFEHAEPIDIATFFTNLFKQNGILDAPANNLGLKITEGFQQSILQADFEAAASTLRIKFQEVIDNAQGNLNNEQLKESFKQIISESNFSELFSKAQQAGINVELGLAQGLKQNDVAISAASESGKVVIAALNGALGVSSPSILAMMAGRYLIEGLAIGIQDELLHATSTSEQAGQAIMDKIRAGLEVSGDEFESLRTSLLEELKSANISEELRTEITQGIERANILSLKYYQHSGLMAVHGMENSDVEGMAQGFKSFPGTSIAVRTTEQQPWLTYGANQFYFSGKDIDPKTGKSILYLGDGMTPTLGNTKFNNPKDALDYLNNSPEYSAAGLSLEESRLSDILTDLVHQPDFRSAEKRLRQQVATGNSLGIQYKDTKPVEEEFKDFWEGSLELTQYPINQIFDNPQKAALNTAVVHSFEEMLKVSAGGMLNSFDLGQVIKEQLFNEISKQRPDLDTDFLSEQLNSELGNSLVSNIASLIDKAFQNPSSSDFMAEAKSREILDYSKVQAAILSSELNKDAVEQMFANGLDPKKTYFYNPNAEPGAQDHIDTIYKRVQKETNAVFDEQHPEGLNASISNEESNQSGKNVASGYAHGMEEGSGQAYNAGKALGESGIAGLKDGAGTHSDSVPATESGSDTVNGFVHALEKGAEEAYQAGYELGQASTQGQIDGRKDIEEFNKSGKKLEDLTLDDIEAEVDNEYLANYGKESKKILEDSISPIKPKIEISDEEALAAWEELGELRDKASKKGKLNKADTNRKEELFSLLDISQDSFKKSNIQAKIVELGGQTQSKTIEETKLGETEQTEKVNSIKETTQALQEQAAAQEQASGAAIAANELAISTEQQEKMAVEETTQAIQEQNAAQEQPKAATINALTSDEIIEMETAESNKTWATAYEDYLGSLDEEAELEAAMGQVSGGFGADAFEEIDQSAEQATESIEKVSEALQSTQMAADIKLNFEGIEEADGEAQRLAASLQEAGNAGMEAGGKIAGSMSAAIQEIKSNGLKNWLGTDTGRGFNNTIRQAGSALSLAGQFVSRQEGMEQVGGGITMAAGGMQAVSGFLSGNYVQAVQGIINTINGISQFIVTDKEKLEQLSKKAENASNESKKARSEERALDNSLKKVDELVKKRYESVEADEAYLAAAEELANQFPQFISGFDEMGNVLIDTSNQEQILAQAREKTASATIAAIQAEIAKQKQQQVVNQSEIETALQSMNASTLSHTVVSEDNIEQHRVNYDAIIKNFDVDPTKVNDWVEVLYDQVTEPVQKLLEETGAIYKQNGWFGSQWVQGDEAALYTAVSEGKFNGTDEETLLRQIFGLNGNAEDSSYQHILNELAVFQDDFDFTQDGALERLNAFIKEVTSFNTLHPEKLPPDWFEEEGAFTKIVKLAGENADTIALLNSLQQQYISGWLSSSIKTGKSLDFVNKNSGLTNILTNYFNTLDKDNDWDKYYSSNKENVDQTIQAFDEFYKRLSLDDEQLKKFEKMSSDTSHYSIDDIVAEFGIGGEEDPVYLALATRYNDISKFVQEQLSKTIEKEFDEKNFSLDSYTITEDSDFETRFKNAAKDAKTSADQKILMAIMDSYKDLDKSGFVTQAEAFGTGAFDFIDTLKGIPSEIRTTIIDTILDNGLLTKEGIQKSIDSINNISGLDEELKTGLTSSLTNAKNNIINNLNLAVSASLDELVENWSDVGKELVSAINDGISLKEAQELVNKARTLGLEDFSLDDFTQSGDKLILSATKFYQYYNKLTETNGKNAIEWEKEYQKAVALRQTATKEINIDENRTLLKEIGFTLDQSNSTYYESENLLTDSGFEALTKALDTYIKNYEDYNNAALVTAEELNSKFRDSIDLNSLYNASTTEERTKAVNELGNIIGAYLSLGNKVSGLGLNVYQTEKQAAIRAASKAGLDFYETEDKLHQILDKFSSLSTEQIINILYAGGEDAINVLKQLKPEANTDEISQVYNAAINRLNTALSDAENIMIGSLVDTGSKLYQVLNRINPEGIDANGVVQSVYNMVDVYAAIYAEMTKTAGATTAGLNDAYAKLLTAQDQINIDITEALKNGNGMSYADFGNLLAEYDIKFEDYMTEHWDTVMRDGFGNIRITDWEGFAKNVFKTDNLDAIRNTDEYISAFKAYNDGLIELNKNTEQAITDEIKQIESAKAGDWLNLSELWTKLQDTTSKAIENVYINGYNGNVELGNRKIVSSEIMNQAFPWAEFTSQDYATIFGQTFTAQDLLENSVFQQTKENIGLVFAQIDEAGQAVTDVAEYATSLLGSTLDSDGHIDIDTLLEYDQKARNLILDVRKYASTMTNDQVWETEDALAQVIHEREEQASNMRHWQIQLEAYGASLEDGILKLGDNANLIGIADTLSQMAEGAGLEIGNGLEEVQDAVLNVLTSIREIISQGIEGGLTGEQVETLRTRAQELGISNINLTETKEGFKLTTESAKELYFALNDLNGFQGEALFEDLSESLIETDSHFRTVQDTLTYINELSAEIQALRNEEDPVKNQDRIASLENELALAEKINMTRSIDSEDDSFNFMDNDIPAAQNNPLNYWQNWADAFKAMKKAGSASGSAKNTIGYEDFYNIVTEIGKLADLSGQSVTLGDTILKNSQDAANLITEAAGALKNVDGEMKIDLSKINIDFSSGLQDLGQQVDEQVDALATEQIAMLDSIIAVLEIIVAMEALEDVDVNKDMHLDFSELGITVDGADNITAVNDNLAGVVAQLSSLDATLEDGTSILDAVSIDTGKAQVSFRDFLTNWNNLTWLSENGITGTTFSQLFNNLYTMAKSDAYNDKEMTVQSIVDLFQSLNWGDLAISVNSGNHTLTLNDSGMYSLNWETMNYDNYRNIFEQEIPEKKRSTDEEIKARVKAAYESEVNSSEGLSVETNTEIKVLQNKVVKIEEGDHKGEYKAGNQYYKSLEQAVAASDLFDVGAKNIKVKGDGETATAEGEVVIGNYHMKVTSSQAGAKFEADDGTEFDSKQAALDYMFNRDMETSGEVNHESAEYQEWEVEQGIRLTPVYKITDENGNSYSSDLNKNPEMRTALKNFINNIDKEKVTLSEDGKSITVEFAPGMEITMPAEGIQFGDDFSEEALKSALTEQLGIDEALKDTISSAIKEAFTNLSSLLTTLDSSKVSELGAAFKTVYENVQAVATGLQQLAENLSKLTGVDIKIEFNLPDLPTGGEGDGVSGEETNLEIPINTKAKTDGGIKDAVQEEVKESADVAKKEAENIPTAIGEGASDTGPAETATEGQGEAIKDTFDEVMEIASPSRVMIEKAKFIGEGIEQGLNKSQSIVETAAEALGQVIIDKIEETATKVSESIGKIVEAIEQLKNTKLDIDTDKVLNNIKQVQEALDRLSETKPRIEVDTANAEGQLEALKNKLKTIDTQQMIHPEGQIEDVPDFETTQTIITNGGVSDIADFTTVQTIITKGGVRGGGSASGNRLMTNILLPKATGNVGLAKASGTQTLMGELGPEMVVSNGHYFVVGQGGPEMVNLADDAIVFNHLQTQQLLKKGMSSGRGRAVTSETNAVAFATGNINGGPAMASASAALAALKQLRAMWESLKSAKVSDLAGAGGGGGGGGGGGKNEKIVDPKAWVKTVERWYNLTQQIAKAEKEITHEEQLRAKLQSDFTKNGKHYFQSQMTSLKALKEQVAAQEQLNLSREDYYDRRVEALERSPLGKIYGFDDKGQLQFAQTQIDGMSPMEWMTNLMGFDENGKANYTNKQKYEILQRVGFGDYMKYDSNGQQIKMDSDNDGEITDEERESFYEAATTAWRDRVDQYAEETQSLWDEIQEGQVDLLKAQEEQNKLLEEMRDNQMEVEDQVLEAIEDMKQREIDALQDERDKLQDSVDKYIDGLTNALDKEREMYDTQESQNELDTQKRRLAILQRSGASAADVSALQNEISANERDLYFDTQQAQIDAIKDASDLEIARLDSQIAIMQETLDYQKEFGLLWYQVYDVMGKSASEITSFIMGNNSDFWTLSPLGTKTRANDTLFQAEQWTSYRKELADKLSPLNDIATWARSELYKKDFKIYDDAMKKEFGSDYDKSGKYKKIFDSVYNETGDLTKADNAARAQYTADKLEEERKRKEAEKKRKEEEAKKAKESSGDSGFIPPNGCGSSCNGYCKGDLYGGTSKTTTKTCSSCSSGCKVHCGGSYSNTRGGGGCFVAGTKIIMADLTIKLIEEIQINDLVLAYDEINNVFVPKKVIDAFMYVNTPRVLDITFDNGITIGATPGHPFLSIDGWKSRDLRTSMIEHEVITSYLNVGDKIISYFGNTSVISIVEREIPENYITYDLEVEDCHTFMVNGLVVHNAYNVAAKKASGGYVSHGIYELGEQGTETVLTASQTQVLRNNILSNRPSSLISLLKSYNENYSNISKPLTGVSSAVEDNSMNIDKVELTMNVQQLASDYDAKRAGEQALNEIMRIARKTSANNSIRR